MDWPIPHQPLKLAAQAVHVWRIGLDVPAGRLRELSGVLSEAERERASRFHTEQLQQRFIAAHGAVRLILAQYVAQLPTALSFITTDYGKPELPGSTLRFNLAHSEALAVCAVVLEREIGVDVEFVKPLADMEAVAVRFFSTSERAALNTLSGDEKVAGFYRCWTRKEAFIKALGTGLSHPLDAFDVTLLPGEPVRLLRGAAGRWRLASLDLGPRYVGAVCAEGHWQLTGWQFA